MMESESVQFIENDATTKFKSSKLKDPYAEDANHGKYWRSLQELKLFRRKKQVDLLIFGYFKTNTSLISK